MIKRIVTICLLVAISYPIHTQQQEDRPHPNSLYASFGTTIFSNQVSLGYERLLFARNEFKTSAKVNFGTYLSNNYDYDDGAKVYEQHLSLIAVQSLGIFEINVGVAATEYALAENLTGRLPSTRDIEYYGAFGIRYDRDHLILRVGIGNLELLYFGLGVGF